MNGCLGGFGLVLEGLEGLLELELSFGVAIAIAIAIANIELF